MIQLEKIGEIIDKDFPPIEEIEEKLIEDEGEYYNEDLWVDFQYDENNILTVEFDIEAKAKINIDKQTYYNPSYTTVDIYKRRIWINKVLLDNEEVEYKENEIKKLLKNVIF